MVSHSLKIEFQDLKDEFKIIIIKKGCVSWTDQPYINLIEFIISQIKINTSLPFLNLEIYNSLGKKMYIPLIDNLKELDISNLEKGVYILKIQSNNKKIVVRKIIKL